MHWSQNDLREVLTLQSVLHVLTLQRNLISKSSLLRAGYRIIKKPKKFVISKSNIFFGKGFVCDCLFWLNITNFFDNKISIPDALNIEYCDIWHGRLRHVNFNSIKKMINLNLILKSSFKSFSKYEICVQGKYVRTPFHSITRNSEPFEIIHSNVCDSNRFPPETVEDILWHSLITTLNFVAPIFSKPRMKSSIGSRCINPKLRINLKGRSRS